MFTTDLLKRITAAECRSHARFSAENAVKQFGPIVASRPSGPALPLDAGWLDNTPALHAEYLAEFEDWCARFSMPATLHLLSQQLPSALPVLSQQGYGLDYVLHLYVHDLQKLPPPHTTVKVHQEQDPLRWATLSAKGFGKESEEIMRRVAEASGTQLFVARLEGQDVACGALAYQDGIAALHGMSTRPEYRNKGAQAALIAARLHHAGQSGAEFATVFVTPSSGSERNAERLGFRLAGMRLTFTRR